MAERYRFFDSADPLNPDRSYNAQEFTDYFKALVTTGIMKGAAAELKVSANGTNMQTTIDTGIAFVMGRFYENDSPLDLTHDTETLGKDRIDRIVIRMDLNTEARYVKAFIKKGVPAVAPVPPELTRTATIYEISLAQVKIIGGQTYISVANVIDERGQDAVGPWAGSNILPNFDDVALNDLVNNVIYKSEKGKANGVATLDTSGKVPTAQLNVQPPADASLTTKGIVKLNDSLASISTSEAATPNAVKQVNDKLTNSSVSIGSNTFTTNTAVAIGQSARAEAGSAVAIGYGAKSTRLGGLALGSDTEASGSAVALGSNSKALGGESIALGGAVVNNWNEMNVGDRIQNVYIRGSFAVGGTKNFEIPHPHPNKKATHVIRHGAVESPTAGDTLYRYTIEAKTDGEVVSLQLPDYFEHLNTNVDVWVNGHLHFGRAYGVVEGSLLKVTCEKAGVYKALVIGTRNDDNVQDWHIKGVERQVGESWLGEVYVFETAEIKEVTEFREGIV